MSTKDTNILASRMKNQFSLVNDTAFIPDLMLPEHQ